MGGIIKAVVRVVWSLKSNDTHENNFALRGTVRMEAN